MKLLFFLEAVMEKNILLSLFIEYLKMLGFADSTVEIYHQKAISYLNFCNSKELDYLNNCDINLYLLHIKDKNKLAPASLNVAVCALKHFYKFLFYREISRIRIDEYHILSFKNKKRIVTVPSDDVKKVYEHSKRMLYSDPRKLYINILYGTGIRPCDCVSLTSRNFNVVDGVLMMNFYEKKKKAFREVPFMDSETALAVLECLKTRDSLFRLLPGVRQLQYYLQDISKYYGLRVSARTFRHEFAYRMLNVNKLTVSQLQSLMGHTNPAMSMWYAIADSADISKIAPKVV